MQRKFRILLHIGTEKTGTTTLQEVLFKNKEHLLKEGVFYLNAEGEINSRNIAAACVGDDVGDDYIDSLGFSSREDRLLFRRILKKKVHDRIHKLPEHVHTIIISSEHFHSRLVESSMIQYLKSWFSSYAESFEIVCYLRRQVDMVVSLYSTILKGGGVETFEGAVNRMLKEKHYCNYDVFLSKWEKVFSKEEIRVRRFERSEMVAGSIVDDFLTDARISPGCIVVKTESTNESITHIGQVLLREINTHMNAGDEESKAERNRIQRLITEKFQGKGRQLPFGEARRLQALFDDSNEKVRARWFPERPFLFDSEFPKEECRELSDEQEKFASSLMTSLLNMGLISTR